MKKLTSLSLHLSWTLSHVSSATRLAAAVMLLTVVLAANVHHSSAQEDPLPLPVEPGFSTTTELSTDAFDPNSFYTTEPVSEDSRSCFKASKPTQLAWFYKPPKDYSMEKLSRKFDIFVLTKLDEKQLGYLHSQGAYPVLQYIHWDSVHDPCRQALKPKGTPCSCNKGTWNNQPAWFPNDICDIRDNHPDWFLRGEDGQLLYWGDDLIMDPGSVGWRNFFIQRVSTSLNDGWDGIFIDNLATRFGLHNGIPTALQKYPTDKSYQDAVVNFLLVVNRDLLEPRNKLFFSNFSVVFGDTDVYLRYMQHMDGSQDEFWAWKRNDPYTVRAWEERFLRAAEALKRNKTVMFVSQGVKNDYNRQQFTFASYLLLASDKTFFRYSKDTNYGDVWLYDNYKLKLGEPLAQYKKKPSGVYVRKFENGKVKVWPGEQRSKIKLKDPKGRVCR